MKSDVESTFGVRTGPGTILPADLLAAVFAAIVADVAILVGAPGPLRLTAASALLFFLPGYAIVAMLYPAGTPDDDANQTDGIDLVERLGLSVGASVASVPILGLIAWEVGPWIGGAATNGTGITRLTTLTLVTLLVVVGCVVAAVRRLRRPQTERFSLPYGRWIDAGRDAAFGGRTRTDRLLSVALAVTVLLAVGAFAYAVTSPAGAEQYTSTSLLTEDANGDLVAGGYPDTVAAGEASELVLELGNHEGVAESYTAVVQVERVETDGGEATVTEASELDRLSVSVPAGESRTVAHSVAPEMTGERLRLSYYVYRGDAPANPSSSAYRHLYIWITVEES